MMPQMMANAPGPTPPRSRHDDCAGQAVEPHRFRSVQDIVEGRMMENLARAHVLEFAGVLCKHLGRPRRQGRVDEYPRMPQTAGVDEHGNVEEQLLRTIKREYRDDAIDATRQRSNNFGLQEHTTTLDRPIIPDSTDL